MKRISIMLALPLIWALSGFAQNQKSEAAKDWIDQWKIATESR